VIGDTHSLDFGEHRLAYRTRGRGPAVVIVSQYWRKKDEVQAGLLSHRWQLFHITPLGYGRSDRVPCLLYWGSDDRQVASKLRRARTKLLLPDADFVEFAGLDHAACNSQEALGEPVVPVVDEWLSRRVGRDW
jgi:hypothetical protein